MSDAKSVRNDTQPRVTTPEFNRIFGLFSIFNLLRVNIFRIPYGNTPRQDPS